MRLTEKLAKTVRVVLFGSGAYSRKANAEVRRQRPEIRGQRTVSGSVEPMARKEDSDFNEQNNSTILTSSEGRLNDLNAAHRAAPAVYSIFTGRKPYLDEYLAEQGKLTFIDSIDKVSQIRITKQNRPEIFTPQNPDLAEQVMGILLKLEV